MSLVHRTDEDTALTLGVDGEEPAHPGVGLISRTRRLASIYHSGATEGSSALSAVTFGFGM